MKGKTLSVNQLIVNTDELLCFVLPHNDLNCIKIIKFTVLGLIIRESTIPRYTISRKSNYKESRSK